MNSDDKRLTKKTVTVRTVRKHRKVIVHICARKVLFKID